MLIKKVTIVKMEMAIVKGITERGVERPRIMYSSFTNRPTNIDTNKLSPTETKRQLRLPSSSILNALRRTNPGTNDRYVNTTAFLISGISNKIVVRSNNVAIGTVKKLILISSHLLGCLPNLDSSRIRQFLKMA
jgi:hypothetical protein